MTKVYCTQEALSVDYTPALEYGDLEFVTSAGDRASPIPISLNNEEIIEKIRFRLKDFTEDDYLLCTGAPVWMAICGAILGNRLCKVLVWDKRDNKYFIQRV